MGQLIFAGTRTTVSRELITANITLLKRQIENARDEQSEIRLLKRLEQNERYLRWLDDPRAGTREINE